MRAWRRLCAAGLALGVAACSSFAPDKPVRATLYDFGPGPVAAAAQRGTQPPIVLADLETPAALDTAALLYRLGYDDAHQLHPYSRARWSAPPGRLVEQRLREHLGRERVVLDLTQSAALARSGGAMPRILRIELAEFSHLFDSPKTSWGVVRMRATLADNTPAGERVVGQRIFVQRQPAPTPDASGGVRALTAATDAAAQEIAAWVGQQH
ncbi:MAG TPA: ABC-type transport auxiliary lipoprotein family protein [Methylibium sp.]|nr:ABC-type transport auxiliary lipoprotein family protein [Methylibium sp.]